MEVPRAVWHWHGTDNRLVRFGAPAEHLSHYHHPSEPEQTKLQAHWGPARSGNSHVAPLSPQKAPTRLSKMRRLAAFVSDLSVCCNHWGFTGQSGEMKDDCGAGQSEGVKGGDGGVDDVSLQWWHVSQLARGSRPMLEVDAKGEFFEEQNGPRAGRRAGGQENVQKKN